MAGANVLAGVLLAGVALAVLFSRVVPWLVKFLEDTSS